MNNWVIVGDNARARFYKTKNATSDFQELQTLIHNESRMHEQYDEQNIQKSHSVGPIKRLSNL